MNDFRLIEVQAPAMRQYREREFRRLLRAEDTLAMHWVDRDWLRRELAEPFDGPTVVVTHHAPSSGSVAERYAADWLTPAFVSELPGDFFEQATLWVHGHTHSPFEYQRGRCRVMSNPRGYRRADSSFENHRFEAGYIVELTRAGARRLPIECQPQQNTGTEGIPVGSKRSTTEAAELAAALPKSDRAEWEAMLAERADMVDIDQAARLAGVTLEQLRSWALQHFPGVIAVRHPELGLRFPRWQFEPSVWPVAQRVADCAAGRKHGSAGLARDAAWRIARPHSARSAGTR
jgi:hypothetical protein